MLRGAGIPYSKDSSLQRFFIRAVQEFRVVGSPTFEKGLVTLKSSQMEGPQMMFRSYPNREEKTPGEKR